MFLHYIHEVLTHREGDKVILTENEYTKKTIDNPNSWWKGWGAYIVVKFPFLFKNQVFNCGNQSRIWGEKFFFIYKLWWKNDGVQDDKYCGKLISGCSCDEENDERVFFVKNWEEN